MAVLADVACVDVTGILARVVDAVVAREAIPRDVGVVEHSRDPQCAVVAIVALIAGDDMPRRLARPGCAVVAGSAAAGHGSVVHVVDGAPGRRRMATVTGFHRRDVIGWFHRGKNGAYLRVAADTGRDGAFEDATGMAAIAADVLVRAIEIEARAVVVERFLRHCRCTQQQCAQ